MNFELILFYAVVVTGIFWVIGKFYLIPKKEHAVAKVKSTGKLTPELKEKLLTVPGWFEFPRSFFPILLLVLIIRSFIVEPFRIPSGSLEPTLLIGDFIVVNKFSYGVRLPVLHHKILETKAPKRGDIAVFRWPPNPKIDYIKRVIGLPGDHISYINKVLYLNGESIPQQHLKDVSMLRDGRRISRTQKIEALNGVEHNIFVNPQKAPQDFEELIVPKGHYFMLGDNRDDSSDSRFWGFVPESNLVGKAIRVWFSWNSDEKSPRWNRMGKPII